jgi:Fic family protein
MILLPLNLLVENTEKIMRIDAGVKALYRLITFSRDHLADNLLDSFLNSVNNLQSLLSIKNAQMEAQNEEEAIEYLHHLKIALEYVVDEIKEHHDFENELQLFRLFRLISPETHAIHPNRYRHSLVQIGAYVCPEPHEVAGLVSQLFSQIQFIANPIMRAIYFHHELIRIHPFADGNGRVTRIAKNWMLMYQLYPPIFIKDEVEKKEYIDTLGQSFRELNKNPDRWNEHTAHFFEQELNRLEKNVEIMYQAIL